MQFLQTTFIWFGIGEALRAPKYYQCKDFVQFQESEDFDDSLEGLALFPCFIRRILMVFM